MYQMSFALRGLAIGQGRILEFSPRALDIVGEVENNNGCVGIVRSEVARTQNPYQRYNMPCAPCDSAAEHTDDPESICDRPASMVRLEPWQSAGHKGGNDE